jgi:hypothetical protein
MSKLIKKTKTIVFQQLKLSKQMGHSVLTQQKYYKKVDNLCDPIIKVVKNK